MRNDPIDLEDAIFIYEQGQLNAEMVYRAFQHARIPDILEIQAQFESVSRRFLETVKVHPHE